MIFVSTTVDYKCNFTSTTLSKLLAMWHHPQLGWEGLAADGAEVQDVYRSTYGCSQGYGGGSYGGYDPSPYSGFYTLPSFSSWSSTAPYYSRVGSIFWIGVGGKYMLEWRGWVGKCAGMGRVGEETLG